MPILKRPAWPAVPLFIVTWFGCAQQPSSDKSAAARFEVQPAFGTDGRYADQIDFDFLPAETRALYDAAMDGRLAGAQAADFQDLLDSAQRISEKSDFILYEFQLTGFDRTYEESSEEGVPLLFVMVQKCFGHIYRCGVTAPEF